VWNVEPKDCRESDPDPAQKCSTCRMQCKPYKTGWQTVCRHTHAYAHTHVHTHTHTHMTGAASSGVSGGTVDMQDVREVMPRTMWRIMAQGLCHERRDGLSRLCRWLIQVCC